MNTAYLYARYLYSLTRSDLYTRYATATGNAYRECFSNARRNRKACVNRLVDMYKRALPMSQEIYSI